MFKILLVSKKENTFENLARELKSYQDNSVRWIATGKEAMQLALDREIEVIVADHELEDSVGLAFIKNISKKCPLVNCAMVSTLDPDEFHEITEGLGVFLQLPENPGRQDAEKIMQVMESIHLLLEK